MTAKDENTMLNLDQDWAYKVTVLADLVYRRVSSLVQAESGLNISQWRVLAAVADKEGRSASQVVDITPMDKGIVSRAVSALIEKDLLERRASQTDGRLSLLFLTAEGKDLFEHLNGAMAKTGIDGTHILSPADQKVFLSMLDDVIGMYSRL